MVCCWSCRFSGRSIGGARFRCAVLPIVGCIESITSTDYRWFTSISGAIIGGLIVGATEKLAEIYLGGIIGSGIENWFPICIG
jgi:hypothetical protein